jgi:hypothetical protein
VRRCPLYTSGRCAPEWYTQQLWVWLHCKLLTPGNCFGQARISQLCTLTLLEVSNIETPLEKPILNDIFDNLPALKSVCLEFCTHESARDSDLDSNDEGSQQQECRQPNDFLESLLRCPCLQCMCTTAYVYHMRQPFVTDVYFDHASPCIAHRDSCSIVTGCP